MKTILVTGGFDPLHSGHIAYFEAARKMGDRLLVGLNSDDWLIRKKGYCLIPFEERATIIAALRSVFDAYQFNDIDDTACAFIKYVLDRWGEDEVIFANGGDREAETCPELIVADPRLTFEFNVGGEKTQASSELGRIKRPWGWWRVLAVGEEYKVKELCIHPSQSISMQRHSHRSEHWRVLSGAIDMKLHGKQFKLDSGWRSTCNIEKKEWHQATNIGDVPCHILELQTGKICSEDDIERLNPTI